MLTKGLKSNFVVPFSSQEIQSLLLLIEAWFISVSARKALGIDAEVIALLVLPFEENDWSCPWLRTAIP